MANLPENTQYGSNTSSLPKGADFANLIKSLQQKAQKSSSEVMIASSPTTTTATNSSLMPHYSENALSQVFGKSTPPSSTIETPQTGIAIGTPIGEQGTEKTEPLPTDYNQLAPADENGKWVDPSSEAVLRNWSTSMGGGQYITDPSQPGKMIKSTRAIMDSKINPGAKQKVLGNLSPSLYQVDHIVPLWIGGADTLANLQVYDNITHRQKTAVQAVPLTLLANGKIDLNQAKLMALTWKDKDSTGLPSADEIDANSGYVPLDVAEKTAKKWQDEIDNPSTLKHFGEGFKDTMSNLGKNIPILGEFSKGLLGGVSAGIIPNTGVSEGTGATGTISNIAGNIAGTIFGLGKLGLGLKALKGVTGGVKTILGIKNAVTIAEDATKAANLVQDIGSLTKSTLDATKRANTLKKMAESAGLLSLWGQIGVTGKEITGQQDAEFKNHVNQFLTDVAFGGLLGASGQNIRGYATVGLGSTAFSLMEGDNIVPALQNGALMTALHGLGYKKGLIDPKIVKGNEEAYKMAATTMNQYVGDAIPFVSKGQKIPDILKLDIPKVDKIRTEYQSKYPNDQRFKDSTPITNDAEAVDFIGNVAKKNFGNLIAKSNGSIPVEDIKKEMTRITVAHNQLLNQTLPPAERAQKEMQDLLSLGEKLRPKIKSEQLRPTTNTTNLLENIPVNTPTEVLPNKDGKKFPLGNVPTTGYGDNIDVISKKTIDDFYNNPTKFSDRLFVVKDPETASIMRLIQQEQIASGVKSTIGNPEHALRVFIKTADGQVKPAGYIPREESFTKKNGLNKTYHEITNRLRSTISRAPSVEELQKALSKDKAGISLTPEEVQNLFNNKDSIKAMSDEDLYALLKPANAFEKYNSALNNSTLSEAMDKNGLNVLIVDRDKLMPTGGAFNRSNPDNPYLTLKVNEQDWLRSIDLKNGTSRPKSTVEQGISDIVSKQGSEKMAQDIGKINQKISTIPSKSSPDTLLTSQPTLESPFLASKMPLHVSETPKPIEVPSGVETPSKLGVSEQYSKLGESLSKTRKPADVATEEFFNDITSRIDDAKVDVSSPKNHEKALMDIVNSFKRENPGLSSKDFKDSMSTAKGRATAYVQDYIDRSYKGTTIFGTEDIYSRSKEGTEKNALTQRYNELQRKSEEGGPEKYMTLKPFEKTEMEGLKVKIDKYSELDKKIRDIETKTMNERRSLTSDEKKQIEKINKEKFTLTQDYLGPKDSGLVMANKFGLELTEPNESGLQFLKLDKGGNPVFTNEFKNEHKVGDQTPGEFWGSSLTGELKVYKDRLSSASRDWSKGLETMKKSKQPYAQGFARAIDTALKEKFDVKDLKTGETKHAWKDSWKLSSILKNIPKDWFTQTNQEGQPLSQPFRRIADITAGKNYADIKKAVAKSDAKTRQISEDARMERLDILSRKERASNLPEGMRIKDPNQVINVAEDLTPFDTMMNGFLNAEARNKLINQYNSLREEMGSGLAQSKPKTAENMKLLFSQIKKLSANIPEEVKTWKLGSKIELKNKGEPTFEEGVKDGLRVSASIFGTKKSSMFIDFNKIKDRLKKSVDKIQPDGEGGPYDGKGGSGFRYSWNNAPWGDTPEAGGFPQKQKEPYTEPPLEITKVTTPPVVPQHPVVEPTVVPTVTQKMAPSINSSLYDVRGLKVSDADLEEAANILYGEISNRTPDKQKFETRHIINTAINRALNNPKYYGGSLTKVLQRPYQYQAYSPQGTTTKGGKVVESQYQKVKAGKLREDEKQKLQLVRDALNELKSGKFQDTTGGSEFYVHASDGTIWFGKTSKEAKDAANKHEQQTKSQKTQWGTAIGLPVLLAKK